MKTTDPGEHCLGQGLGMSLQVPMLNEHYMGSRVSNSKSVQLP